MFRIVLGLIFLPYILLHANEKVTILAEDAWYPYSGIYTQREAEGLSVDLIRAAFAQEGVVVNFKTMPYDRAKSKVEAGEFVACFNVPSEPVIEKRFVWPEYKLFRAKSYYYARNDYAGKTIKSVADLAGIKVGLVQGYGYGDAIDNDMKMKKVWSRSDTVNIRKLLAGRFDVMVLFEEIAKFLVKDLNVENKIKIIGETEYVDVYLAFSKRHPRTEAMINVFNKGMAKLHENGLYKKIMSHWRGMYPPIEYYEHQE